MQCGPIERAGVVNVSGRSLTVTTGDKVRGCSGLIGIVVHYTLLYIIGGNWESLSNCCIMGPPLQCSGLYLVDWCGL